MAPLRCEERLANNAQCSHWVTKESDRCWQHTLPVLNDVDKPLTVMEEWLVTGWQYTGVDFKVDFKSEYRDKMDRPRLPRGSLHIDFGDIVPSKPYVLYKFIADGRCPDCYGPLQRFRMPNTEFGMEYLCWACESVWVWAGSWGMEIEIWKHPMPEWLTPQWMRWHKQDRGMGNGGRKVRPQEWFSSEPFMPMEGRAL